MLLFPMDCRVKAGNLSNASAAGLSLSDSLLRTMDMVTHNAPHPKTQAVVDCATDWMLYRITGVHYRDLDKASTRHLAGHLRTLDRILKRERNKGLSRHWSYDLNRHITLKTVRDLIAGCLNKRGHRCAPASPAAEQRMTVRQADRSSGR
jgi:hypothetical protein